MAFRGYIFGLYRGSMRIMERNMEATIIGYIGLGLSTTLAENPLLAGRLITLISERLSRIRNTIRASSSAALKSSPYSLTLIL